MVHKKRTRHFSPKWISPDEWVEIKRNLLFYTVGRFLNAQEFPFLMLIFKQTKQTHFASARFPTGRIQFSSTSSAFQGSHAITKTLHLPSRQMDPCNDTKRIIYAIEKKNNSHFMVFDYTNWIVNMRQLFRIWWAVLCFMAFYHIKLPLMRVNQTMLISLRLMQVTVVTGPK